MLKVREVRDRDSCVQIAGRRLGPAQYRRHLVEDPAEVALAQDVDVVVEDDAVDLVVEQEDGLLNDGEGALTRNECGSALALEF